MDMVSQRDLVSMTLPAPASAFTSVTAGGAGNNAPVVGVAIDRFNYGVPLTGVFTVQADATLGAGNTLSVKSLLIEHSVDGVTWATFTAAGPFADPGVVLTGPAGGGTVRTAVAVGAGLREANRFVRFTFTPVLSAANGDTATVVSHATLGGFDQVPPVVGSPA